MAPAAVEKGHRGWVYSVEPGSSTLYSSLWDGLLKIAGSQLYEKGTLLFDHGKPAEGVYLVQAGEVRLALPAKSGAEIRFGMAGPGAVLALSEATSSDVHKLRAVVSRRSQIALVRRADLIEFLAANHELCLQVVHILSEDLHGLYHRFQYISPKSKPRKAVQ